MATFAVKKVARDCPAYRVVGPDGTVVSQIHEFLVYLSTCGRSAYTIHSYATGLAHFFGWLREAGKDADEVTRHIVGQYLGAFGRNSKSRPGTQDRSGDRPEGSGGEAGLGTRRKPRTINHRLSVLASYFAFCIQRDDDLGCGPWFQRANPASTVFVGEQHRLSGRDLPARRRRGEFRRRVPRQIPRSLEPAAICQLIAAAASYRDKAILTLLAFTGQRIGDWHETAGRHGVLGLEMADVDLRRRTITVRLKGDRDQHRVPVTEDFWPLFNLYLSDERGAGETIKAVWVAARRGKGKPLSYSAFESSLRYISHKAGVEVHAHMFRHTVAQAIMETTGNLKVAQELLGHAQVTTTANLYMQVDERMLVDALSAVRSRIGAAGHQPGQVAPVEARAPERYAFAYDPMTIKELEEAAVKQPQEGNREDTTEPIAALDSGKPSVQPG